MKIVCPVCQPKYDLKDAAVTSALREMVDLAAGFGPAWPLVDEYVECFRQSQWGSIDLKKRIRLLREVAKLWETCEFSYQGRTYRVDHARIREALTRVNNLEKFGFQNHNYLKKVMLDTAERVSAEGLTAREEAERYTKRREPEDDWCDSSENSRMVRELIKGIGKGVKELRS